MSQDRVLPMEGIRNFRDYGGYDLIGGGRVKRGVLWRSGQHIGASDADLAVIAGIGLATVFDLRGPSEREINPCRRHEGFAGEVIVCEGNNATLASHVDAAGSVETEADARAAMRALYTEMPYRENLLAVYRRFFPLLGERGGASLIHCFAGKDRTGLAVALVHHVLGVHRDDIMQDYLLTNEAMQGRKFTGNLTKDQMKYASLKPEAVAALSGVKEEYLEAAFTAMRASHGTIDRYLAEVLGVDDALSEKIKLRLIEG